MKTSKRHYRTKLINESTPFAIKESFFRLRTNIMYTPNDGEGAPVYAVTSSDSGVGKSTVSANLALSFAQIGKKVLLIDADMRLPTQYKFFNISKEQHGLSELLSGIEGDYHSTVIETPDGLSIITAGCVPPNPASLLHSRKFGELVEEWKKDFDLVLIDCPPANIVTDPLIISGSVSGYIVVLLANYSRSTRVNSCIANIERVGGKVVGVVVNSSSLKGANKSRYSKSKYAHNYYYQ